MNQEDINTKQKDISEIDEITRQFFDLFTNTNNRKPDIRKIKEIFLQSGLLINNTAEEAEVYDLESFIRPREEILTNGTLINFMEHEIFHKTEIHVNIAQRMCIYKKSGILNGKPFSGEGKKLMQFIKIKNRWLLSSVLWSDKK